MNSYNALQLLLIYFVALKSPHICVIITFVYFPEHPIYAISMLNHAWHKCIWNHTYGNHRPLIRRHLIISYDVIYVVLESGYQWLFCVILLISLEWCCLGGNQYPGPLFTKRWGVIPPNLEAAIFDVIMVVSLWNLTCISAALLPRCLSNFGAIGKVKIWIPQLRDFTRSYSKAPA